jgi:ABC-2 type transport system ATP-binding protein
LDIQAQNISKCYGTQKAVDNISFSLKKGDILGFLGPNGAGKSTTMKMLTAYFSPTSGEMLKDGKNIYDDLLRYKSSIGYLPENNPLYNDMYVVDFLSWSAALQGVSKAKIKERLKQTLHFCGLEPEMHKKIGALSKGYKQRVGLAQAIIHDPEILILDEPTTGLDPNQVADIRALIKDLGKEKAILFSTHILSEVEEVCNRVIIINNGKIIVDKPKHELTAAGNPSIIVRIQSSTAQAETISRLLTLADIRNVSAVAPDTFEVSTSDTQTSRKAIMELCIAQNWNLIEMSEAGSRLENIFRQLTQGTHE